MGFINVERESRERRAVVEGYRWGGRWNGIVGDVEMGGY